MPESSDNQGEAHSAAVWFTTTRWSLVLAAGQRGSPESSAALEQLCRAYWYPLYSFVRRSGYTVQDSQDLTQEFFARLITKDVLRGVAREKGRFRSFLLVSLKHLMANERDRAHAIKRGGGQTFISIDAEAAEDRFAHEPVELAPEALFDRQWALSVLDQALARLREENQRAGKSRKFEILKAFLSTEANTEAYDRAAAELGMSARTVAVAVSRLRGRYRELVRAQIADTVATAADVEEEMRYLVGLVG